MFKTSIIVGTIFLLFGASVHAGMNIAVLAGIKKLPNSFHDEIEHQTAIGVQFEHTFRRFSYVVTFLRSADKYKLGEQYSFVEKTTVSTTELRFGVRHRFNTFYLGGGPALISTTQKYKWNSGGPNSLLRSATQSSNRAVGAYLEIGKDWKVTNDIRVGIQYNLSKITGKDDAINGVGQSIVLGTLGYRF